MKRLTLLVGLFVGVTTAGVYGALFGIGLVSAVGLAAGGVVAAAQAISLLESRSTLSLVAHALATAGTYCALSLQLGGKDGVPFAAAGVACAVALAVTYGTATIGGRIWND